jgi:hypothetical protein
VYVFVYQSADVARALEGLRALKALEDAYCDWKLVAKVFWEGAPDHWHLGLLFCQTAFDCRIDGYEDNG